MLSNFVIYLVALKYYVLAVRDVFAIGFSTVPRAFIYLFVVTMTGTVIWRMFRSNWGA